MLEELQPLTLSKAALALGVDPLEVVRLLVVADMDTARLSVPHEDLERLRTAGGIESWWVDATLPEDDNSLRAAIRGALGQLVERGLFGDSKTRLDNLWRGLSSEQQVAIEQAAMTLVAEGKLEMKADPKGVLVSAPEEARSELEAIVAGEGGEELLGEIWQG